MLREEQDGRRTLHEGQRLRYNNIPTLGRSEQ